MRTVRAFGTLVVFVSFACSSGESSSGMDGPGSGASGGQAGSGAAGTGAQGDLGDQPERPGSTLRVPGLIADTTEPCINDCVTLLSGVLDGKDVTVQGASYAGMARYAYGEGGWQIKYEFAGTGRMLLAGPGTLATGVPRTIEHGVLRLPDTPTGPGAWYCVGGTITGVNELSLESISHLGSRNELERTEDDAFLVYPFDLPEEQTQEGTLGGMPWAGEPAFGGGFSPLHLSSGFLAEDLGPGWFLASLASEERRRIKGLVMGALVLMDSNGFRVFEAGVSSAAWTEALPRQVPSGDPLRHHLEYVGLHTGICPGVAVTGALSGQMGD